MSQFDRFVKRGFSDAGDVMGELVSIDGQNVSAIFDEQVNEWSLTETAEVSDPTTTLVIPLENLRKVPSKRTRFIRLATNETFFITEVIVSLGNVELKAVNETKRNG